jgi:hypothetical protein
MVTRFVRKREAAQLTGLSEETLKKLRLNGELKEGIEWVRQNSRCVLYNAPLLIDFIQNRNDPAAHQRAITAYLASLPSNQPKTRGRKAS